jgi:hypothetical protein
MAKLSEMWLGASSEGTKAASETKTLIKMTHDFQVNLHANTPSVFRGWLEQPLGLLPRSPFRLNPSPKVLATLCRPLKKIDNPCLPVNVYSSSTQKW